MRRRQGVWQYRGDVDARGIVMRATKTTRGAGAAKADTGELSQLPAGPILLRLRRLLITTGLSAVVYAVLATGSKGRCCGAGGPGAAQGTQTYPFPFNSPQLSVTTTP
ncbi:hypothetical protein ASE16_06550 [Leifsonia sp. Root227]|nr:hypothetical protein ASE16_06550 [Leifsonia sp. Root227]